LVGYIENAFDGIDRNFDGTSITISPIDLYSLVDDKKLNIQGKALPFNENDIIPLGYKVVSEGNYTISIDSFDGLFTEQPIFLKDKFLNTINALKESSYTFSSSAGTFHNRFEIVYQNSNILGITQDVLVGNSVVIETKNGISIQASDTIQSIAIFDLLGRKIYQKEKVEQTHLLLNDFSKGNQVYIVKVKTNTFEETKKIIY
jgi:hypothetical protein